MKVDVIVPTKNSSRTLAQCLESIIRNVPVNRLIVVDGGSTDETVKIAKKYGAKIIVTNIGLGYQRYLGAAAATTDWIVMVDSDVALCKDWFSKLAHLLSQKNVVWVAGSIKELYGWKGYANFKFKRNYLYYSSFPAGLGSVILKRKTVLGCEELRRGQIHVHQDYILYQHVLQEKGKAVLFSQVISFHINPNPLTHELYGLYRGGKNWRRMKSLTKPIEKKDGFITKMNHFIKRFITFTHLTQNPLILSWIGVQRLVFFIGYLNSFSIIPKKRNFGSRNKHY